MKATVIRSRIAGALEAETNPSDCDDALRDPDTLELLAQATDRDVERLRRAVPVLVPHVRHQAAALDDLVAVGGQDVQHLELLAGQRHLLAADVDAAGRDV